MKITKHDAKVILPEMVEPGTIALSINCGAAAYMIMQVDRETFEGTRHANKIAGQPQMFCLFIAPSATWNWIELWPIPDKHYEAAFSFCPRMKTI